MRVTKKLQRAVQLVAEGTWTFQQIAHECGISIRCLSNWRATQEFQQMVSDCLEASYQQLLKIGIANPRNRLLAMDHRWAGAKRLMAQRGKEARMQEVPGGDTGLLIRRLKTVSGKPAVEHVIDKPLMSELRLLENAAQGETTRYCATDNPGANAEAEADLTALSDEQIIELRKMAYAAVPRSKAA